MLVLTAAWPTHAAGAARFAEGNQRYAAGDHAGAAQAYEAQVARGEFSANLFYNLGDTYYRLGQKGRAILNYRRALFLEPGHGEAAANLTFVAGGTPMMENRGASWNWLAWGVAAAGWTAVAGLWAFMAGGRRRKAGLVLTTLGLLLCLAGIGAWWFLGDGYGVETRAVVLAEATPALYSPVEGSKVVTSLAAGGEVRLLSEQGAWTYVLLADGTTRAWLSSKNLEPLVPR